MVGSRRFARHRAPGHAARRAGSWRLSDPGQSSRGHVLRQLHLRRLPLQPLSGWLRLGEIAFALNVIWEFAQAPLYGGWFGDGDLLLGASVKDALIIVGGAAVAGAGSRICRPAFTPVLVVLLLGVAYAIEFVAVHNGRWSYASSMPIIVGGVGLSPFLQLAVTGVVAIGMANRLTSRAR